MNEFASQRKTTPHDLKIILIGQTLVVQGAVGGNSTFQMGPSPAKAKRRAA